MYLRTNEGGMVKVLVGQPEGENAIRQNLDVDGTILRCIRELMKEGWVKVLVGEPEGENTIMQNLDVDGTILKCVKRTNEGLSSTESVDWRSEFQGYKL
jgi:hypothetical protein